MRGRKPISGGREVILSAGHHRVRQGLRYQTPATEGLGAAVGGAPGGVVGAAARVAARTTRGRDPACWWSYSVRW